MMARQPVGVRARRPAAADGTPDDGGPASRRRAALGAFLGVALVAASMLWASLLVRGGTDLHLSGGPPLTGRYDLRLPVAVLAPALFGAGVVWLIPSAVKRLRWPVLVLAATATAAAWTVLLAVTDGVGALGRPLSSPFEYLRDVPRVNDLGTLLEMFTAHVREGSPGFHWTTHVGGHPPGALLAFVGLDRLGLGGPGPAAALCIGAGVSAVAAVLVTVKSLGGEHVARAAAPFVALSPVALWVATSADALFLGVAAWGVCCLVLAAARTGSSADGLALAGGLLLGLSLFLSYGLALIGVLALAVVAVRRRVRPLVVGAAGALCAVAGFAAQGFWWLDGLAAALARVREGTAWQDRPSAYFVVANLAALAIAVGPAVVAGLAVLARRNSRERWWGAGPLGRALVLPAAASAAVLLAIGSNLSKGEAERIYLPFAVWLLPAAVALPARDRRWWLATQLALALAVQIGWRLRW